MSFWTYRQQEDAPENGVLQIDGVLEVEPSWWSSGTVVARDIRQRIERSKDVTVYINSPGGDVMAGAEIYTALREHAEQGLGKVTVKVTGIAASAASVVAMAGDEVLMSPVSYMMIHNPWTVMSGNARELRKQADVLDVISEGLIAAYQRRTGKTRDELAAMLADETYMSAQTCVDEGFADGILYEAAAPADPAQRGTAAKMTSRAHGRQAVMAALREHGGTLSGAAAPPPPEGEARGMSAAAPSSEGEARGNASPPDPDLSASLADEQRTEAALRAEIAARAALILAGV